MPGLWVRSPVGVMCERQPINVSHVYISLPSLPSLKKFKKIDLTINTKRKQGSRLEETETEEKGRLCVLIPQRLERVYTKKTLE